MVAIVDRINLPATALMDTGIESVHSQQGSDGFSLWPMHSGRMVPNPWVDQDSSTIAFAKSDQGPGFLDFVIQDNRDVASLGFHRRQLTLRLGLANTTFENGQLYTCFVQQWTVGMPDNESKFNLILSQQRDLPSGTVFLPQLRSPIKRQLTLPTMKPLTPPQIVSKAQGNVISTLQRTFDQGDTEPASTALERGIADFRSSDNTSSSYEVWAKVVNREFWPALAENLLRTSSNTSPYAFVRYLKVSSGGGGYGARQGLLALDPEPVFPDEDHVDFNTFKPSPRFRDELFASLVRPGDAIRFYATFGPAPHIASKKQSSSNDQQSECYSLQEIGLFDGSPSMGFGSLPTSSETVHTEKPGEVVDGLQCLILKHFGAVSESGLWFKVDVIAKPGLASIGALPFGTWSRTKLPPFSSVLIQTFPSPRATMKRTKWH